MELMEQAKLLDITTDTIEMIREEFPELAEPAGDQLNDQVKRCIHTAKYSYKISSFDALQDFTVLCFQYAVLLETVMPPDLLELLTWPDMKDDEKISETRNLLARNYHD